MNFILYAHLKIDQLDELVKKCMLNYALITRFLYIYIYDNPTIYLNDLNPLEADLVNVCDSKVQHDLINSSVTGCFHYQSSCEPLTVCSYYKQ